MLFRSFTYTVTVEVEPVFELSSYEPIAIELPSAEVSDVEVEEQINHMISHYTDFAPKGLDAEAEDGDRLTLKISAKTDGGRQLDNLTSDEFSFTIGSVLMPDTFSEELKGMKVGSAKTFEIPVPLNPTHYLADLSGKALKVVFDVEVRAISGKTNPELTDEWVSETFGFTGVDEFRDRIREMVAADKEEALPHLKEDRVMEVLRTRLLGEPSEAMCSDKESELMQNFFQQLQRSNTTYDIYLKNMGITKEQFRDDVKQQAKDQCIENLALNAWAKNKGLTVTPEEVTAEFEKADAEHAAEMEAEWRANGQLHLVRQSMLREKAFHEVIDTAVVTEEKLVVGANPIPETEEKPKKAAKKTTKKAAEAEAAAEEAPAEEKSKRARKTTKKAEEAAPEAAEEAPKPKRTRKPKADAEAPAAE